MGKLQDEFDSHLRGTFQKKLADQAYKQLSKSKIKFTKKQITQFQQALTDSSLPNFDFGFTASQIKKSGFASKSDFEKALSEELIELEKKAEEALSKLSKSLPATTLDLSAKLSEIIASGLEKTKSELLQGQAAYGRQFNDEILTRYKPAFDIIESMIVLSIEGGELVSAEEHKSPRKGKLRLSILFKLHARACQIASEILVLLKNGYPDGAMARWRTMYEIMVISLFLSSENEDLSRRYLAHEAIEDHKAAQLHQQHFKRTNSEPIRPKILNKLQRKYDALKRKYGKEFATEYGWASKVLKNPQPNFSQIENKIDLSYLRPYYKIASYNVHASPHGIKYRLGLPLEEGHLMLTGPSQHGLEMPAKFTALTLTQITANLILLRPSMDSLVITNVMRKFQDDAYNAIDNLKPR